MTGMRPVEERHVPIQVDLMLWTTKFDLLALSYANGEVILHRLNWLKVWVLSPPAEGVKVVGIAWRPDGKVIAIGYSNRQLLLVNVENKSIINDTTFSTDITTVIWSPDPDETSTVVDWTKRPTDHLFLPLLPSLTRSSNEKHITDAKAIEDQHELNFLYVGLTPGLVVVCVFGLYPRAVVDVRSMLGVEECRILDVGWSIHRDVLLVTALADSDVWVMLVATPLYFQNDSDIKTLANKYGQIRSCLDYMDLTMDRIIEGWENIMMEMETKLRAYASKVSKGRVSSDFLELLMFGTATRQMLEFLLDDLTEKGLKKLNHSIEISYNNIQSLVLKHLQAMGQSLTFQLSELCGLSRCPSFGQSLGLPEAECMAAFAAVGSFMVKVAEVQNVIDESLKKYKAFFRWLYAVILRLSDGRVGAEHNSMSQEDLQHIVDFLCALESERGFNLEQLGQYLVDADLTRPAPSSEAWEAMLKRNPTLAALPQIVPHHKNHSLVQEADCVRKSISTIFQKTQFVIEKTFEIKVRTSVRFSDGIGNLTLPKVSHSFRPKLQSFTVAILDPLRPDGYHAFQVWTTTNDPHHNFVVTQKRIVDLQFYMPDVLAVLFEMSPEPNTGIAYFPCPLGDVPYSFRVIEGIVATRFALCGKRKVAVFLSESRRKVKVFEMEAEEDDDEEIMDTTNSSTRDDDLDLSVRI